jgi:hypothetical protein
MPGSRTLKQKIKKLERLRKDKYIKVPRTRIVPGDIFECNSTFYSSFSSNGSEWITFEIGDKILCISDCDVEKFFIGFCLRRQIRCFFFADTDFYTHWEKIASGRKMDSGKTS